MGKTEKLMARVHPGEILREDFMKPLGLSVNKLALELHVPATRIGEILHERRRITAETALRLARYFKTNAEFWLNLQNFYDLERERRAGKSSEIERQVQPVGGGRGVILWASTEKSKPAPSKSTRVRHPAGNFKSKRPVLARSVVDRCLL